MPTQFTSDVDRSPESDDVRAVCFDSIRHNHPYQFAGSWAQLQARLCIRRETERKEERALWSPVVYRPNTTRGNRNVIAVTCLVVDMDGEAFDYAKLDGLEWMAYTTWSHRPHDQHWHLVLPLKHAVPVEYWGRVWLSLHERLNVVGDPATKDPARIFYMPQYAPGQQPDRMIGHGERLDAQIAKRFNPKSVHIGAWKPMPRSEQTRRNSAYWRNEDWWNEPQDLSRFAGMTEQEIMGEFRRELAEIRKNLVIE